MPIEKFDRDGHIVLQKPDAKGVTKAQAPTAVPAFKRVFTNAIRLLVTIDEAEAMVKNMIRIAKSEAVQPSQAIAAYTILNERLEGKTVPSDEELEASGVKVVVLPNYGQALPPQPPALPEFEEIQDAE